MSCFSRVASKNYPQMASSTDRIEHSFLDCRKARVAGCQTTNQGTSERISGSGRIGVELQGRRAGQIDHPREKELHHVPLF